MLKKILFKERKGILFFYIAINNIAAGFLQAWERKKKEGKEKDAFESDKDLQMHKKKLAKFMFSFLLLLFIQNSKKHSKADFINGNIKHLRGSEVLRIER